MPASDISRLSTNGLPRSDLAASYARSAANYEVGQMIQRGQLNPNDVAAIRREYKAIYYQEYYKNYANFLQQDQQSRIIYTSAENASARKFFLKHTVANFSKLNCFIHVHQNCITVGRFNYPLDQDDSPEIKEAFLTAWPGPLNKPDVRLKRSVIDYIETLRQHDSQRRIRYNTGNNDDQRKVILRLFTELLHRNGTIDASGVTKLLLREDQTEIQRDEGIKKPWETLQKYLLLGKRSEAIRFAKARKLWDHAQCLAFLDKYQPPNTSNYMRDGIRLRDDSIVQLNDEYISSIEHRLLSTVYRSLMNRILQYDPESVNIVKHPNVGSNEYEFALLSANDCDMEFDQSNEIFKLITAVKQAMANPHSARGHLISLGFPALDSHDLSDDLSYRSHLSFKQGDTHASRTLTISNTDMLILNEIWEYCLNLARGTCVAENYCYLIDLVPYKLVFAAKLLDFGLHEMFYEYLGSITTALAQARSSSEIMGDSFYDWPTIERCVQKLTDIWNIYRMNPDMIQHDLYVPESQPSIESLVRAAPTYPSSMSDQISPNHAPNPQAPGINTAPAYAYQEQYLQQPPQPSPPPTRHHHQQQSQLQPVSIDQQQSNLNDELTTSYDQQPWSNYSQSNYTSYLEQQQQQYMPGDGLEMTSSSPVNKGLDSMPPMMSDSITSPFSPINEEDEYPPSDGFDSRRTSIQQPQSLPPQLQPQNPQQIQQNLGGEGSSSGQNEPSSGNNGNKSQQHAAGGEQPSGLFTSLFGSAKALLPKSNSKPMILPDDSKKSYVYDSEKQAWVDKNQPESSETTNTAEPPPMFSTNKQTNYSFPTKSSKRRYPTPQA